MEVKIHYLTRAELRQMESGINLEEITPQEYLSLLQPLTQTFTLTVPVWRGYLPEIELKAWAREQGYWMEDFAYIVGGVDGLTPDGTFPQNENQIVAQWPDMVDAPCEYRDTWCDYGQRV